MSVTTTEADDSGTLFTVRLAASPYDPPYDILTTVTNSAAVAAAWISDIMRFYSRMLNTLLVGLDCEWRPNFAAGHENPVAVLQLCVDRRCLVFQILRCDHIPQALVAFLSDRRLRFLGVGIHADVEKLTEDYQLAVSNKVDLRTLAAQRTGRDEMRRMGIKTLAGEVIGITVNKPKRVTMSRWDQDMLMLDQIGYAAVDAFISFEIGRRLIDG